MERYTGQGLERSPCSWGVSPFLHEVAFTNLEALQTLLLRDVYTQACLVIDSVSLGEGGWAESHVLLVTHPHPEGLRDSTQSHPVRTKDVSVTQGFRSLVSGTEGRDQIHTSTSHYVTSSSVRMTANTCERATQRGRHMTVPSAS